MVNYESDEAIQEIQDEMYRTEETRPSGPWAKLTPQTRMIIAVGVGILLILALTGRIPMKDALLYGAIGVIVIYLMNSGDPKRSELTWLECMIRINDLLEFLQQHPVGSYQQIPKGEIRVHPVGRKQWYEGKAYKRSFKTEIYDQEDDLVEIYFIEVDVFTGDIITFRHSPEGVYGDETRDIKLMPGTDMLYAKKRDQFLGKARSEGR